MTGATHQARWQVRNGSRPWPRGVRPYGSGPRSDRVRAPPSGVGKAGRLVARAARSRHTVDRKARSRSDFCSPQRPLPPMAWRRLTSCRDRTSTSGRAPGRTGGDDQPYRRPPSRQERHWISSIGRKTMPHRRASRSRLAKNVASGAIAMARCGPSAPARGPSLLGQVTDPRAGPGRRPAAMEHRRAVRACRGVIIGPLGSLGSHQKTSGRGQGVCGRQTRRPLLSQARAVGRAASGMGSTLSGRREARVPGPGRARRASRLGDAVLYVPHTATGIRDGGGEGDE